MAIMKTIAIPMSLYKFLREVFSMKKIVRSKLSKKPFVLLNKDARYSLESKEMFFYTRKTADGKVTLCFPEKILADGFPSITLMMRAFYASLIIANEQRCSTITFTKSQKLRKMGYSNKRIMGGGKIFKKLEVAERALECTSFFWKNDKKGEEYIESNFRPLYSKLEIDGSGKGAVFNVTLDADHIKNIDLTTGEVTGQFVILPMEYVFDRRMRNYERNIREKALEYLDLPILNINGSKLLGWACLPKSLKLRKKERERMFSEIKRILSEMGFSLDNIRTKNGKKVDTVKDHQELKFTYCPRKTERKSDKEFSHDISPEEKEFIDDFVKWQISKKSVLSEEKIREEITNTLKVYGLDYCQEIYETSNHPMKFWNEIKIAKGNYEYEKYR